MIQVESNLRRRLLVQRGTLRKTCLADGAGRLVLALVLGLLASVLLDYFFFRWDSPVNTAFRILVLTGLAGTLGVIGYLRLIAPLRVPLSMDDMALAVEKEFPRQIPQSPFYNDAARRELNRPGGMALSERGAGQKFEMFLFYTAVTRARRLVVLVGAAPGDKP
jgi:hypothetical protein